MNTLELVILIILALLLLSSPLIFKLVGLAIFILIIVVLVGGISALSWRLFKNE